MIKTKGYYDLNISEACVSPASAKYTLKILYDYGYRTIAINQVLEENNLEPKRKKKKGEPRDNEDIIPSPFNLTELNEIVQKLKLTDFKVLTRLTVVFSNPDCLHKITKSENYKKYDLIAACPQSLPAFTACYSILDADILSFNAESSQLYKFNRKLYNKLIEKGYHYEIQYSPAIEDSTKRKNTIQMAHLYKMYGKSRNIIISSGASTPAYIRNPYDIVNLGMILGLNEQQCKNAVLHCSRRVVLNSVGRRHGKAIMYVEAITIKDESVVVIESDDEEMDVDMPAQKRPKS